MEGSSSNITQTDIPESSCRCKRKQPEGTAADPINIDDDNQPYNTTTTTTTTLCTCRNQQQITQTQGQTNVITEVAEENRNVRPRRSRRHQSSPTRFIPDHQPSQQEEELHPPPNYGTSFFRPAFGFSYDFLFEILEAGADMQYMEELGHPIRDEITGLTEEQIQERMERHVYRLLNNASAEEVGTCCVCLDDFCNNDEIGKLDCAHQFHYECIKQWLKEKNSCPMCKRTALADPK